MNWFITGLICFGAANVLQWLLIPEIVGWKRWLIGTIWLTCTGFWMMLSDKLK